jgi:general secretion pathway protein H
MPTSATGSSRARRGALARGFTMVELLIVIAIIALSVALVAVALPDGDAARLDEDAARLTALLEMARAESRVSGAPVVWVPAGGADSGGPMNDAEGRPLHFRFVGLPTALAMPTRWLDDRVQAQLGSGRAVVLGPSAILPPQRIVLSLGQRRVELVSDGLGPFAEALPTENAPRGAVDAAPR